MSEPRIRSDFSDYADFVFDSNQKSLPCGKLFWFTTSMKIVHEIRVIRKIRANPWFR